MACSPARSAVSRCASTARRRPLFYAQSGQVNVQVPYTVAGSETVAVEVRYQGKLVGAATVPVAPSAPAMLALATNSDGSPNAHSAPAPRAPPG